jgi:adenosylhomocysteine nucleosidase
MRIALLAPMASELRPVVKALALRKTSALAPLTAYEGELPGRAARLVAVLVGVGTQPSAAATATLLQAAEIDHVVVVGITGGVRPDAHIGQLVHPEVVVHGPSGREHGHEPVGGVQASGAMWTSDDIIRDAAELAGLAARGVVALDMETAAIAHVCDQREVPWTVVRAISDLASDPSIDEEVASLTRPDGTPDLPAVARYVARDPRRAKNLARLGRDMQTAADAAAQAAADVCRHLANAR